jgi:hypothetical protein
MLLHVGGFRTNRIRAGIFPAGTFRLTGRLRAKPLQAATRTEHSEHV